MKDGQFLSALPPASRQSQKNPAPRILVVDDDVNIRRLNAEVLGLCGYEVDAVEDGAAAWELLSINHYQLLITDNTMPKVSGVELLKQLWAARMALPVIMATGRWPVAQFTQFPWLQPTAPLLKPYTVEQLIGTVRNVLHATEVAAAKITPPPDCDSQPAAMGMRLA